VQRLGGGTQVGAARDGAKCGQRLERQAGHGKVLLW
jgi:hypothetical protein